MSTLVVKLSSVGGGSSGIGRARPPGENPASQRPAKIKLGKIGLGIERGKHRKNWAKFIARYYFPLGEQRSCEATFGTHCNSSARQDIEHSPCLFRCWCVTEHKKMSHILCHKWRHYKRHCLLLCHCLCVCVCVCVSECVRCKCVCKWGPRLTVDIVRHLKLLKIFELLYGQGVQWTIWWCVVWYMTTTPTTQTQRPLPTAYVCVSTKEQTSRWGGHKFIIWEIRAV